MSNSTVDEKQPPAQPAGAGPGTNQAATNQAGSDPAGTTQTPPSGDAALDPLTLERDNLLAERADLQERLVRRQAEFDNFRRRAERERTDVVEYANTETIRGLLPILDDFERALKIESFDKEYSRGMELIYQRLSESFKRLGLEPFETAGQTFDPHVHHAVEMVESSDHADHTILDEYQRGYNFKGKLLRPAMVKVAVQKT